MSFATSDLASVLVAPDREFAGFAQGVLRAWNSDTFENTVHVRGSDLHDLPVASGVEALTYQPGDVLMLTRWRPGGGGTASWWIGMGGRVVYPGSGRAEETIAWLRGELARSISAEIFADRIQVDEAGGSVTNPGDWTSDSDGPEITITMGSAGTCLAIVSAHLRVATDSEGFGGSMQMSFEVLGATTLSPLVSSALNVAHRSPTDSVSSYTDVNASRWSVITLNEGENTISARYRSELNNTTGEASASARVLTVIPLA